MTIDEFIEAVNALPYEETGGIEAVSKNSCVFLRANSIELAGLETYATDWAFVGHGHTIPTKILKLMVELAESREEENKYVILNGKPFSLDGNISTRVFVFNEGNLSFATVSLDEMADFSYTKGELKYWKATLPKNLQEAVDLLTVTVSEAKKVLKNDD